MASTLRIPRFAMAEGVKRRFGSDWAIATTGVAGPGESDGIAAGNIWIAIVGADGERS